MLPIILNESEIEELIQYSKRKENVEINLEKQEIIFGNKIIKFDIDQFKKKCLLEGLDDIALSLEKTQKISSYENNIKKNMPWIMQYDQSKK
jgi:3-isopropylmalate/(R)-2-methylmalate dehydratase small subunit